MARRNRKIEYVAELVDRVTPTLRNVERSADRFRRTMITVASSVTAAFGIRELVDYADQWTLISSKIRIVTADTRELLTVQSEVVDVALRTRTSLSAVNELYTRVARSSTELGVSQRQVIDFTESVSQAIRVSGATAQEASAGIIQFAQGLASGQLRGEELRSVMEQLPRLAIALANGLDMSIGELREFGFAGKLTADKVFEAITRTAPQIEKEFNSMVPTVAQAMEVLRTGLLTFVGEMNTAGGATARVAENVKSFGEDLTNLSEALTGGLAKTDDMGDGMKRFATALIVSSQAVAILAKSISTTLSTAFDTAFAGTRNTILGLRKLAEGELVQAAALFALTTEDVSDVIVKNYTELNEELISGATDAVEKLAQIWDVGARTAARSLSDLDVGEVNITPAIRRAAKAWEEFVEETDRVRAAVDRVHEKFRRRDMLQSVKDQIDAASDSLDDFIKETERAADEAARELDRIGFQFASAFEDAVVQGETFRELLQGIAQDILRLSARKLVTEPLAAFISGSLGGLFGRSAGGPVAGGQSVRVHEGEIATFGGSGGHVTSRAAQRTSGGSVVLSPVTNIDARGADPGLIARLPKLMDERDKRLMLMVKRYVDTGAIPI